MKEVKQVLLFPSEKVSLLETKAFLVYLFS